MRSTGCRPFTTRSSRKAPICSICLSSAVGIFKTPEQRLAQIVAVKPEMASYNTNRMNFSIIDRNTGMIFFDYVFDNTFTMLQDFGKAFEENKVKPEIECYDIGGIDNTMIIAKQGFFTEPMNFNFVWGVTGGQQFRPEVMIAMKNALPPGSNFTTCAVGIEQFPANMMSCILGGNMRVGMEDNTRMPNGELAKGSYEQVEWCRKGPPTPEPGTGDAGGSKGNHGDPERIVKEKTMDFSISDEQTHVPGNRVPVRKGGDRARSAKRPI